MALRVGVDTTYTITASEMNSFNDSVNITLFDIRDNQFINLRNTPIYIFTASPTNNVNRFIVYFNASGTSLSSKFGVNGINEIPVFTYDNLSESKIYTLDGKQLNEIQKSGLYVIIYKSFAYKIYIQTK